jgi:serine beta-lactamase-like protein LACTB, mitochondrial
MKRFAALSLPCFLLFLWLPRVNAQEPLALPEGTALKLATAVADFVKQNQVAGLSVAVAHNGRVVWCKEVGKADLEHELPVTRATRFRLASVSKSLTAVAVMRLAEKGKIDLDAPVQKYVSDFPEKPRPITVRQLLCHTSGIRHYRPRESESTRRYASLSKALDIFKNDDLLFEPGTKQGYSTYAYTLLGCVLEKASGKSFMDCLREEVFEPAGMVNTHADDVYAIVPHRARGYARVSEGQFRNAGLMDSGYKIPGGGLLSPAEDLAKFAAALQSGKLLQDKTVAEMATRQKLKDGKEIEHGLGWRVDGTGALSHGGAQQGTSAFLLFDRPNKAGIALLANSEGVGPALSRLSVQLADVVAGAK